MISLTVLAENCWAYYESLELTHCIERCIVLGKSIDPNVAKYERVKRNYRLLWFK